MSLTNSDRELLPEIFAEWLTQALGDVPPREHRADCKNCLVVAADGIRHPRAAARFREHVYIAGKILASGARVPEGVESVGARISRGVGVVPLGLMSTPVYETAV